tara:strand:+ start:856 stop:1377 length:522 start_codon:yes stop_codon:yes gene_type:complete
MSKLFFILNGLTRGYPTIIIFATILFSIIQLNKQNFVFGICLALSDIINHILKEYVAKPLMKNNKIPILGYGKRPSKTAISSMFSPDIPSDSYGMPSGHAQIASVFSTYWIFKTYEDEKIKEIYKILISIFLIFLVILVMYSRVYWMKCHTMQQVIVGGIIGFIIGFGLYKYL